MRYACSAGAPGFCYTAGPTCFAREAPPQARLPPLRAPSGLAGYPGPEGWKPLEAAPEAREWWPVCVASSGPGWTYESPAHAGLRGQSSTSSVRGKSSMRALISLVSQATAFGPMRLPLG